MVTKIGAAARAAALVLALLPRACGGGSPDPQCDVVARDDTTITLSCPGNGPGGRERRVEDLPWDSHPGCRAGTSWPVCQEVS